MRNEKLDFNKSFPNPAGWYVFRNAGEGEMCASGFDFKYLISVFF